MRPEPRPSGLMLDRLLAILFVVAGSISASIAEETIPRPDRSNTTAGAPSQTPDYLVGCYYFCGWWADQPNKYNVAGRDWRTEFCERIPTLGQYNEQATMDREIAAAADHGVDFFQILWYPQFGPRKAEPHQDKLNVAVEQFMNSTNTHRMKFTIKYVNHTPFLIESEADWVSACRYWSQIMQHPSYLRVDGRPVFKLHSVHHFIEQNKRDQQQVQRWIDTLRRIAKQAGAGDVLISGGVSPGAVPPGNAVRPYDFLVTYMDMPKLDQQAKPYPYQQLVDFAEAGWKRYQQQSSLMYMPYLPAGWDPRPWKDPRPSFAMPDREQWTAALERVRHALDENDKLGIPTHEGGRQKAFIIYAWNEFAEGGIVAPTSGEGNMKLECIHKVFGKGAEAQQQSG